VIAKILTELKPEEPIVTHVVQYNSGLNFMLRVFLHTETQVMGGDRNCPHAAEA